ncbi:MAG: MIP/aquaporin family protein [Parascardovia denticolens]
MEYGLWMRVLAECIGTAMLVLFGCGSIAAANLKGSKAKGAGWLNVALGFGVAIGLPVMIFGGVSGAHLNPAITLALAVYGQFKWAEVLPYILGQLVGAFIGAAVVYFMYYPYFRKEEDPATIFGVFATNDANESKLNYFVSEFFATMMLVLGIFGSLNMAGKTSKAAGFIMIVALVAALIAAMGGPTGAAMNPARDLMPRLFHQMVPIAHKGGSRWGEAWIPVIAPICGAICGYGIYFLFAR